MLSLRDGLESSDCKSDHMVSVSHCSVVLGGFELLSALLACEFWSSGVMSQTGEALFTLWTELV